MRPEVTVSSTTVGRGCQILLGRPVTPRTSYLPRTVLGLASVDTGTMLSLVTQRLANSIRLGESRTAINISGVGVQIPSW